jgi:argininosuccinate lyase
MPFRSAHEVIGSLVRTAEQKRVPLHQLDAADLRAVDSALTPEVMQALDAARAVAARALPGGPAPVMVEREVARLESELRALGLEL